MVESTKEIVKATAPALQEYGVEITTRMYERMAEEQPDLKALFANTRNGQAARLAGAVLAYAQNIDEIEQLAPAIAVISKKHDFEVVASAEKCSCTSYIPVGRPYTYQYDSVVI